MINFSFAVLWGFFLLGLQQAFHMKAGSMALELDFTTLLIIYLGFSSSFWKGFLAATVLSFLSATLSFVPPGLIVVSYLILYGVLQLLIDQILTEAYLTKMFWVFSISLIWHILVGCVLDVGVGLGESPLLGSWMFWGNSLINTLMAAVLSFPLFMILDWTRERWYALFSKPNTQLTGADFFAVKSKQRKYLQ